MPEPLPNPHVADNNARNLPAGTVLERPEGELKMLWLLYANILEREARAKRKSNRKQRRRERTHNDEA